MIRGIILNIETYHSCYVPKNITIDILYKWTAHVEGKFRNC